MSHPVRTRTGMGRSIQAPRLRGIDLFNAAQQKSMAAKSKSGKYLVGTNFTNPTKLDRLPSPLPSTAPTEPTQEITTTFKTTEGRLSSEAQQTVQKSRKETPEEYRARHAAKADPAERARILKEKALERERAKILRGVIKEFKKRCHEESLCLNCGWPGHAKRNCPDAPYVPVWNENGELSFEQEKPKATPAQDALTSEADYDRDAKVVEMNEK